MRRIWPKNPFERTKVTCVACSPSAYRELAHGIDVEAERRAQAAELAGLSRAEVRAYILAQPEWRRARLFSYYLYECMFPAAMELVTRTDAITVRAAESVRALDAETERLRELFDADGADDTAHSASVPGGVDGTASADSTDSAAPTPGATVATTQSNKAAVEPDTATPVQDPAVCTTSDQPTRTAQPDAEPIPTDREPQMASPTAGEPDVPTSSEPDHRREPSSRQRIGALVSQAAARVPRARVLIPRIVGLTSKPGQTPDDQSEPAATKPRSWRRRMRDRARSVFTRRNRVGKRRSRRRRTSDGDAGPSG